jgi:plastocyanin
MKTPNSKLRIPGLVTAIATIALILSQIFINMDAFASLSINSSEEPMQSQQQEEQVSNSTNSTATSAVASDIYNTKKLVLGSDIGNLVILIPNEGHHGPGEDNEARFIAQSFVPETAVINKGTNVMWFNGDVGHEHDIVVTSESDNSSSTYQTGEFTEFEAGNYTFNKVGQFQYADTVEYDNGYIMRGNISVVDDGAGEEVQRAEVTLGLLMVPTQDISQYTVDLQNRGLVLDSMYNFQDLRGGQSGTGDGQTLIVWRAPSGMETSNVISQLAEFSEELPYS